MNKNPQTHNNKEKNKYTIFNKKRISIFILVIIFSFWLFYAFWNYFVTWSYKILPYWFNWSNPTVTLSLNAWWNNSSLAYYPGWYRIVMQKDSSWKRKPLTSFEVWNPNIQLSETGEWYPCTTSWQANCEYIKYRFKWFDPSLWVSWDSDWYNVESIVESKWLNSTIWYDLVDKIKENATTIESPYWRLLSQDFYPSWVIINSSSNWILLSTFWWDDDKNQWVSYYKSKSKKFAIRWIDDEVAYLWVASSNESLFSPDGTVDPNKMYKLNFASVWLSSVNNWWDWKWTYFSELDSIPSWDKQDVNILTIDMDNIHIDNTSSPQMYSYIDIFLYDEVDGISKIVDYNWNAFPEWVTPKPIYRISARQEWFDSSSYESRRYPATLSPITWLKWPSWSFVCNDTAVTIWMPVFKSLCIDSQGWNFKWISQHQLKVPSFWRKQFLRIDLKNWSELQNGNAFAIAWNIDLIQADPDIPLEEDLYIDTDDVWRDQKPSDIIWITSVEVDVSWSGDWENGFNDNGINTVGNALHTYKTEICNSWSTLVDNVTVKLSLPNDSYLIWTWTWETSSLYVDSTWLDIPLSESTRLPIWVFSSNINIWTLDPWICKSLSFQTKVNMGLPNGTTIIDSAKFKYDWIKNYIDTNQVSNSILSNEYDADIVLTSVPWDWSTVNTDERITYMVDVNNNWTKEIKDAVIKCPKMKNNNITQCVLWECWEEFVWNITPDNSITFFYTVDIEDSTPTWTQITEQCTLEYEWEWWVSENKVSNIINHNIKRTNEVNVNWWTFVFTVDWRPKLLNSPDWNPRPDWYDQSPLRYKYEYSWSKIDYMYPNYSKSWTWQDDRWKCDNITWQYTPNSISYNINSSSTLPRDTLNLSSTNWIFNISTNLPSDKPKTILYNWSLTPTDYFPGNDINNWYQNWWIRNAPSSLTTHRWIVNGNNWRIESSINWTIYLDKWQYRAYSEASCFYESCSAAWDCLMVQSKYPLYHWELVSRTPVNFSANDYDLVSVDVSSWWLKTEWWRVHTNDYLDENWTEANVYDLWDWVDNVKSAPKLYSPPWSYHSEYMISSATNSTNLKSEKWWEVWWVTIKKWHGYVYDRNFNPRDFYHDLLVEKKSWANIVEMTWSSLSWINLDKQTIYHYPWNLTLYDSDWEFTVKWFAGTILVEWDLYVNSNVNYDKSYSNVYLWIIVKWNIYIKSSVTRTHWAWYNDWTLNTWWWTQFWWHFWQIVTSKINLERKAPEYYERDVNDPSEWIIYDNDIHFNAPPGFSQLDDWIWNYFSNVNQYSWEIIDIFQK